MLQFGDFQTLLADMLFGGNTTIAGLIMYTVVLGLIFAFVHNLTATLIVSLPLTLVFSSMGIISGDLMILIIIITVLGLAMISRGVLSG